MVTDCNDVNLFTALHHLGNFGIRGFLGRGYDVDFYIGMISLIFISHGTQQFGTFGTGQGFNHGDGNSSVCLWGLCVLCGIGAVRFIICGRFGAAGQASGQHGGR